MLPVVVAAAAIGAVLLGMNRSGAGSSFESETTEGTPAQPAGIKLPKRCEPADTWFEKTQSSHGVSKASWDELTCSEKRQVMALGPLAINSVLLGRAYPGEFRAQLAKAEKAAKKAQDAAKNTLDGAKSAVKKISPF